MDGIIMAAGKGSRLRPLTDLLPKPLVPVAGRGTLLRLLEELPSSVDRIILVVGYLQEKIREAIGDTYRHIPVEYVVQDVLDGTGGALRRAEAAIRSERFLVINGDDLYLREDLEKVCAAERGLMVFEQTLTKPSDVCLIEDGKLVGFQSRQAGERGAVNVGAYVLGREWFRTEPVLSPGKTDEWSLPHAIPQLLAQETFYAIPATFWMMCGTLEEIQRAEAALKERGQL